MGQLLVRNVPDEAIAALKLQAAGNGRSMEAELRYLIEAAVKPTRPAQEPRDWLAEADQLRALSRGRSDVPSWMLIREARDAR